MAAVPTSAHDQSTYYPAEGRPTRIDYICAPLGLMGCVDLCRTLPREGRSLQLIPDSRPRDHRPLLLRLVIDQKFKPRFEDPIRWDRDRIMDAWKKGRGRIAFLQEVERRCSEGEEEWTRLSSEGIPDTSWESLLHDVREVAKEHFVATEKDKDEMYGHSYKKERSSLLKERAELREQGIVDFGGAERLKVITRKLSNDRKAKRMRDMVWAAEELEEAQKRGDAAVVYGMVRRLAGTGTGAKNRVYYAAPTHQPTKAEWREALSASGYDGGMEAHFVEDWDSEFRDYKESAPALLSWTVEAATEATDDMNGVADQLRRMPKRRAAPTWSLPLELFAMIMNPGRLVENHRAGVGLPEEEVSCEVTRRRAKSVILQVRRSGVTPLVAHRSMPALLRKKYNVEGTKGVRMIHVLCPFWRAWYRQVRTRHEVAAVLDCSHGFVAERRREGAMMVQMLLAHRLHKANISSVATLHDGTNAFASTIHEALRRFADPDLTTEEANFFDTRGLLPGVDPGR